jgi:hypothetical protein
MAAKTKVAQMSDERYKKFREENEVAMGAHSLEVYEGDLRLYSFRGVIGHEMFMGEHKYKYSYHYELYRGEKFIAQGKRKGDLVNAKAIELLEKWS